MEKCETTLTDPQNENAEGEFEPEKKECKRSYFK